MNNDLMKRLIKASSNKHISVLSDSEFFHDKDNIPTDLPILNIAFSGTIHGGLVSGLTTIAGESKSFKTMLGLLCMKAYLNKYPDAIAVLYDSEGGITPEYLSAQGIDPSRVVHVPIEHLEMLKFDMVKTLKEIERKDKVFMLVDSIGNTASLKELEDAENEKSVAEMQRAKALKALFRIITPSLIAKDVPCVCIAHTYKTMEMYSKNIISGGTGIMYSSNQAFIISKAQEKDKDGTLSGWNFTINIEKSRYVREKAKFSFLVEYNKGISKWSGLMDLAVEANLVEKIRGKGYKYHVIDQETGEVSPDGLKLEETNNKEFWNKMFAIPAFDEHIKNKYSLNTGAMVAEDQTDEIFADLDEDEE